MCLLLLQYCWAAILKSASSSASDYCWTCDWLASSASWILTVGLMQPDCSQEITQFPAVSMTVSLSLWLACLFEGSWKPQQHNNWPHGCASWLVSGACGPLLGEAWNYGSWKSSRLNLRHLYCMAYTRDPVQCSDTWIQTSVLHCKLLVSVPNYYFKTQIYGGMLPCLEWCEHHLLYPSGTWHQWMLLSVTTLCVKIKNGCTACRTFVMLSWPPAPFAMWLKRHTLLLFNHCTQHIPQIPWTCIHRPWCEYAFTQRSWPYSKCFIIELFYKSSFCVFSGDRLLRLFTFH